jgi:hypothetical protein
MTHGREGLMDGLLEHPSRSAPTSGSTPVGELAQDEDQPDQAGGEAEEQPRAQG